jgi:aminoacrylate hydrolase
MKGSVVPLHVEVLGPSQSSQPSILLSSGLGGSANYWKPQLAALLSAGWRVIVYDQLGTGRSPAQLPSDYTIDHMAADVLAILAQTETTSCHFVGHALGGLVGLQTALIEPERVASLSLINAWAAPNTHTARCFDVRLSLLAHGGPEAYVAAQPIFLYPAFWAVAHAEAIESEVAHALEHFPGRANMLARISALRSFNVQDRLQQIGCPAFLSAAIDDVLIPWTQSRDLALGLPSASIEYSPQGGHAHNVTCPDAFNRSLLGFLASLRPLN